MLGDRGGEARMLGAASVEVGAQRDDDRRRSRLPQVDQVVEEARPGRLVRAEREHLLQLVDDDQRGRPARRAPARAPPPDRSRASAPRPIRPTPGRRPARTRDDFPLPDAPTTAMKRSVEEPLENRRHDLLPSEEEVAVVRVEGHQPAVRAGAGAWRDRQAGGDDGPRRRQLGDADLRRQPAVDRCGRRVVDQKPGPGRASSRSRAAAAAASPPYAPGLRLGLARDRGHARAEWLASSRAASKPSSGDANASSSGPSSAGATQWPPWARATSSASLSRGVRQHERDRPARQRLRPTSGAAWRRRPPPTNRGAPDRWPGSRARSARAPGSARRRSRPSSARRRRAARR